MNLKYKIFTFSTQDKYNFNVSQFLTFIDKKAIEQRRRQNDPILFICHFVFKKFKTFILNFLFINGQLIILSYTFLNELILKIRSSDRSFLKNLFEKILSGLIFFYIYRVFTLPFIEFIQNFVVFDFLLLFRILISSLISFLFINKLYKK